MRAPQKPWTHVSKPQSPNVNDSTLYGAWPVPSESDLWPDASGNARDMTKYGKVSTRPTLLGRSTFVVRTATGILSRVATDAAPNAATLACWVDITGTPLVTGYFFCYMLSAASSWGLRISTVPNIDIVNDIANAGASTYPTAVSVSKHHVVATIQGVAPFEQRLYIDGNLAGSGTNAAGNLASVGLGRWHLMGRGLAGAGDVAIAGKGGLINPQVFSEVKDQAWVTKEYLKGADAIQFKTDWGIRASGIGRNAGDLVGGGPFSIPVGDPGVFKVTTEVISGKVFKIIECTTAGHISVPWARFGVQNAEQGFGSWSFWGYVPNTASALIRWHLFNSLRAPGTGGAGYRIEMQQTGNLTQIYEQGVGTKVSGPLNLAAWQHNHVTRRYDGTWELLVNGVSAGTNLDSTMLSGKYTSFQMTAGCKIIWCDITGDRAITKYLGVVPPNMG